MILDMLVKIALYEQALATITDRGVLFSLFSLAIIMLIISNLWEWWTMGGFLLPLSSLITPQSKYASIWLYLHSYLIWFSVAGKILIFFSFLVLHRFRLETGGSFWLGKHVAVISLFFHYSWNSLSACFNYSKLGCFFELTILHWNCEPPLPCKSSSIRLNLPLSCITLFHFFASVLTVEKYEHLMDAIFMENT